MPAGPPQEYLVLLDAIYPGPRAAVEKAWGSPNLAFCRLYPHPGNRGLVCLLRAPEGDFSVGYLSFEQDAPPPAMERLRADLQPFLPSEPRQELCFNLYGRNLEALRQVQAFGFRLDMSGLKYRYPAAETFPATPGDLRRRTYRPEDLAQYADLLDGAYAWLQGQSGLPVSHWAADPQPLGRLLQDAQDSANLLAYWQGERLAGLCLTRADGYIDNLAVHPDFQNRGFGRYILSQTVAGLLARGAERIHLDVAAANLRAQHFYQTCGFIECGCFADHTYFR